MVCTYFGWTVHGQFLRAAPVMFDRTLIFQPKKWLLKSCIHWYPNEPKQSDWLNFCLVFPPPGSLFENEWSLKPEYKRGGNRLELADRLASRILWIGVANLLLCPVILVWQILYAFFSYTEVRLVTDSFKLEISIKRDDVCVLYVKVIKREPGSLGARCWSLYGRCYLRHFNELDHELMSRLSKGYKVSGASRPTQYACYKQEWQKLTILWGGFCNLSPSCGI